MKKQLLSALALIAALAAHAQDAPELSAAQRNAFASCLRRLPQEAAFRPISAATFEQHMTGMEPDASVLAMLDKQPEFTMHPWDYIAMLVDDERVADARAALAKWGEVLARIEARYGVPAHIVVAVWGVESNFGQNLGARPLMRSLATLACLGRRQSYFRGELAAALRIVQDGHIPAERMTGSWAGAFGQTQFMPGTFLRLAVDFDGDGRRDIVDSVPDALASTARFLQAAKWQSGQPWGFEVRLPAGFDTSGAGRRNKRRMESWRAAGVTLADGSPLPSDLPQAGLLLPAGPGGPAFLVGRNFDAIYSYNASENYALAIAHLSDLARSRSLSTAFATPWPTDDPGLSRSQRRQLQSMLIMRGHDIGAADGAIGEKTRAAIRAEQQRLGHTVDGRPGQRILRALQTE
ncbi:MAG: lytic murein transglycosylase [Ottowia sp.]|nr:lytic murein transglycosylase [Ottowia sp.]